MKVGPNSYAPLSVIGLELEYAIVDSEMQPRCLVEDAFRVLNGRPTSDVSSGGIGFSNELAAHVVEVKMLRPEMNLNKAEDRIIAGVRTFQGLLQRSFAARLLPTGMHPLMKPTETVLWRRAGHGIYSAYARIFDVRQHGWLNVQSCHVNLPFGHSERDLVLLHNAVACLLPYLPAVAASSPLVEGEVGPHLDNRLAYYRENQRSIPVISGRIIPEVMDSVSEYRRRILRPIYAALGGVEGGKILCHDWVNSRGAILRFARRALEIRLLDVQECVRMDIALATFVRAALRWVVRELGSGAMELPPHDMLVNDFDLVVSRGRNAVVEARHLAGPRRAGDILSYMLGHARTAASASEQHYLDLAAARIEGGSIAERICTRLGVAVGTSPSRSKIRDIYEELMVCFDTNEPWGG